MRQFHEGISSKTYEKKSTSLNKLDLALITVIGLVLSISVQ